MIRFFRPLAVFLLFFTPLCAQAQQQSDPDKALDATLNVLSRIGGAWWQI